MINVAEKKHLVFELMAHFSETTQQYALAICDECKDVEIFIMEFLLPCETESEGIQKHRKFKQLEKGLTENEFIEAYANSPQNALQQMYQFPVSRRDVLGISSYKDSFIFQSHSVKPSVTPRKHIKDLRNGRHDDLSTLHKEVGIRTVRKTVGNYDGFV